MRAEKISRAADDFPQRARGAVLVEKLFERTFLTEIFIEVLVCMKKNLINKIYIGIFFAILVVPLLAINRDSEDISEQENRPLSALPQLFKNGSINKNITTDIENYLNDRIGFRDALISANALMQYHIFDRMENGKRYRLGPDGEFHIIENSMLEDYQHLNLFSDEKLAKHVDSFETVKDYLEKRNCEFYYMQCWDKQSIYPEYFPRSVNQYGDISRTDQLLEALGSRTDIDVIPLKQTLIDGKDDYEVYSKYGDPVHWTQRGAFLSYNDVMDTLNKKHDFKVLGEDDFDITITDQGMSFYGGVRRSNFSEDFKLKNANAVLDENYKNEHEVFGDTKIYHFTNDAAGNDTRVMIVGNSFIVNYLKEDFAESFGDMLMVWNDIGEDFPSWVEEYDPDIVIFEMVERYASYGKLDKAAKKIKGTL